MKIIQAMSYQSSSTVLRRTTSNFSLAKLRALKSLLRTQSSRIHSALTNKPTGPSRAKYLPLSGRPPSALLSPALTSFTLQEKGTCSAWSHLPSSFNLQTLYFYLVFTLTSGQFCQPVGTPVPTSPFSQDSFKSPNTSNETSFFVTFTAASR